MLFIKIATYSRRNHLTPRLTAVLLLAALCLTALLPLTSCSKKAPITVWVYSEEYRQALENYLKNLPLKVGFKAQIRTINASDFKSELDKALADGDGMPDVFMLSPDNIKSYVQSDLTADVTSLGLSPDEDHFFPYTLQAARDSNGVCKAVGWQADPGVFMYRRSMAKVYLGTDNPDEIQAMVKDWDTFYDTARKVYQQSGGKTRMLAGPEDMMKPFLASDNSPWVVNGSLILSNRKMDYVSYMGKLAQEHLIYHAEQWSEAWLRGISDSQSVFGYFSSGICMQYVMKQACGGVMKGDGSFGDWAVIPGPASYCWGGSWLAAWSGSQQKEAAGEFIGLFTACTQDEERLEQSIRYFRTTGEFAASSEVVSHIRFDPQFEDSFIGGQNYYQQLAIAAADIDMSCLTVYDSTIESIFKSCMNEYAGGLKSSQQAISDFKTSVKVAFPEMSTGG